MAERGAGLPRIDLAPIAVTYGNARIQASLGQGSGWFGPLAPFPPVAPPEVAGRQFDFPSGYNLQIRPRAYEPISFSDLRALADGYDLIRTVIETRKDQMERLDWRVTPRASKYGTGKEPAPNALIKRAEEVETFLHRPDGELSWKRWLRSLLEDMFVIDASSLYCLRSRGGELLALEIIDGATIKRVIDDRGRTPKAPLPAYQQVLKGLPAVDYTTRDLFYRPRNLRPHKIYGFSPVEQILMTINIALRRQVNQLQYYTEGNIPESLIGVPDSWTPSQIKDFQTYWDTFLEGDTAARRHAKFIPAGVGKTFITTKEPELKNVYDEWLARVVCFAFSIPPSPFIAQVNRATAQTSQEVSIEEGLEPIQNWVKDGIDEIIVNEFNSPDLEFLWGEDVEVDPSLLAEITQGNAKVGLTTLNEGRARLGYSPDPNPLADTLMVLTQSGYVPIGAQPAVDPNIDGEVGKMATAPFVKRVKRGTLKPIKPTRPIGTKTRKRIQSHVSKILSRASANAVSAVKDALGKASGDRRKADDIANKVDLPFDDLPEAMRSDMEAFIEATIHETFAQIGTEASGELVDQVNTRALAWLEENGAELVSSVDASTRDALRELIADGLENNIGIDEIASSIEGAFAFSEERAELIARTEVTSANSMAALETYQEAKDAGVGVKKLWILGDNPCPICEANAAQGAIELDEVFESGDDAPGAHPNCECALTVEVAEE